MIDQMQERIDALTEENRALKDKIARLRGILRLADASAKDAKSATDDVASILDGEGAS